MHRESISIFDTDVKIIVEAAISQHIKGPLARKTFRRDHADKAEILDFLEQEQILKVDYAKPGNIAYSLSCFCLRIADNKIARNLLNDINRIFRFLHEEYDSSDTDDVSVKVSKISSKLKINKQRLLICFQFLLQIASIGRSQDLSQSDAVIFPGEGFEKVSNFSDSLDQMFNARFTQKSQIINKTHGNTEVHALKREQVLGAALAVLSAFPEECKNNSGEIVGSKVARLVDQKSLSLFDTKDGDPPMSLDSISRLINKWLKIFH